MIVLLGKNLSKAWHGSIVEVTFVIFFFTIKGNILSDAEKSPWPWMCPGRVAQFSKEAFAKLLWRGDYERF
jgi:hypothetical protein